jgi:hypothetical protein
MKKTQKELHIVKFWSLFFILFYEDNDVAKNYVHHFCVKHFFESEIKYSLPWRV